MLYFFNVFKSIRRFHIVFDFCVFLRDLEWFVKIGHVACAWRIEYYTSGNRGFSFKPVHLFGVHGERYKLCGLREKGICTQLSVL